MGLGIYGYTSTGHEIRGPYFGRFFGYLLHSLFVHPSHHDSALEAGLPVTVTAEQLRASIQRVSQEIDKRNERETKLATAVDCIVWAMCGLRSESGDSLQEEMPVASVDSEKSPIQWIMESVNASDTEEHYGFRINDALRLAGKERWSRKELEAALDDARAIRSTMDAMLLDLLENLLEFFKHCLTEDVVQISIA